MTKRTFIIGLAVVAAVSIAMPALGAKHSPTSIALKALRIAKQSSKQSKRAVRIARRAQGEGDTGPAGQNGTNGIGAIMGFAITNATPRYAPLNGGSPASTDVRRILSPNRTITLSELGASVVAAPTGMNALTFTVRVNSAPTSLTCTIPPGSTSCSSTASATVGPRSQLSMELVQSGVTETFDTNWSVTAD
jgi:hypothetical protein